MKLKSLLTIAFTICTAWSVATAQDKMVYFDENYVMPLLPEYKTVQTEMDIFQKQIKGEADKMEAELKKKSEELKALAQQPSPSMVLMEAKQKEAQEIEARLQTLESNAQVEFQNKLAKKLEPLNLKVGNALDELSKENGTIYVMRREACVFIREENNISDLILKKLGITPATATPNRGNVLATNKIGYFDQNYVIPLLPEYKKAETELGTYRSMLKSEMEKIQQEGAKSMQELEQAGANMPEAMRKQKEEELRKLDAKFGELQQSASAKIQEKYNKFLEPIIKNVQTKIEEVAKENAYTFVFRLETSLLEPKEANISDLVLKKMGITPPVATEKPTGNK